MTQDFAIAVAENRVKQGKAPRLSRETPPEIVERMQPNRISGMVAWLCHKECTSTATIHEAGAGYFAQLRWQRSAPLFATEAEGVEVRPAHVFPSRRSVTCCIVDLGYVTIRQGPPGPEAIRDGLMTLNDFDSPEYSGERANRTRLCCFFAAEHILVILTAVPPRVF
eukprot:COSAG02_NODE_7256_length_3094_cov_19.263773_3_plen_167_part_00